MHCTLFDILFSNSQRNSLDGIKQELKSSQGKITRIQSTQDHSEQLQRQQYLLLERNIEVQKEKLKTTTEKVSKKLEISDGKLNDLTAQLDDIQDDLDILTIEIKQPKISSPSWEANFTDMSVRLEGLEFVLLNVTESEGIHFAECKNDFERLNTKVIHQTNSLENFRREVRSFGHKIDRLGHLEENLEDKIDTVKSELSEKINVSKNDLESQMRKVEKNAETQPKPVSRALVPSFSEKDILTKVERSFVTKIELGKENKKIRDRLDTVSNSVKSIVEDSYQLLESKMTQAALRFGSI